MLGLTTSSDRDARAPAGAGHAVVRHRSPGERLQAVLHRRPFLASLAVLVVSMVVFFLLNPRFGEPIAISRVVGQVSVIAVLAAGQTLIILTAGIDLSVGALAILSSLVMAKTAVDNGLPGPVALLVAIAVAVLAGCLNGVLVTRLRLPPFIATLGTYGIFTAVALLYAGSTAYSQRDMPATLTWMGNDLQVGEFTLAYGSVAALLLYAVLGVALSHTAWGRHVYAVGDDPQAAQLAGLPARRVVFSVYALSGLICGLGAWVLIGRTGSASASQLADANLESITAVVIGGVSLFGGRGALVGTLIGVAILGSFRSGLGVAGVDDQWRVLTVGVLVIAAVAADQWIRKVRA